MKQGIDWISILNKNIMNFWMDKNVFYGEGIRGNFNHFRNSDGSLINANSHYVRVLSSHVYQYAMAFHLSGEIQYLEKALVGGEWLLSHGLKEDKCTWHFSLDDIGNAQTEQDLSSRHQAACLAGISALYYVTHENRWLECILNTHRNIVQNYFDESTGLVLDFPKGDPKNLTKISLASSTYQVYFYLGLIVPAIPNVKLRNELTKWIIKLLNCVISKFYFDGFFWGTTDGIGKFPKPDVGFYPEDFDFNQNTKTLWILHYIGALKKNNGLCSFAEKEGKRQLSLALVRPEMRWAQMPLSPKEVWKDGIWWRVYTMVGSFSAYLNFFLRGEIEEIVSSTQDFWIKKFIDYEFGEVFKELDSEGKCKDAEKVGVWKDGMLTVEFALTNSISHRLLVEKKCELFFAFEKGLRIQELKSFHFHCRYKSVDSITICDYYKEEKVYNVKRATFLI